MLPDRIFRCFVSLDCHRYRGIDRAALPGPDTGGKSPRHIHAYIVKGILPGVCAGLRSLRELPACAGSYGLL